MQPQQIHSHASELVICGSALSWIEKYPKRKGLCVKCNINSGFNVISDSGMQVLLEKKYALMLTGKLTGLPQGISRHMYLRISHKRGAVLHGDTLIDSRCLVFLTTGFYHCDPCDSNGWPQRLLPVLDWPEQGKTPAFEVGGFLVWILTYMLRKLQENNIPLLGLYNI